MKETYFSVRLAVLFLALIFSNRSFSQNTSTFFGFNAWMGAQVGSSMLFGDLDNILTTANSPLSNSAGGALQARMYRLGGKEFDIQFLTQSELFSTMSGSVTTALSNGLEPIFTIPVAAGLLWYWNNVSNTPSDVINNVMTSANLLNPSAGNQYYNDVNGLVTNIVNSVLSSRPNRYYIIGNEPDKWGGYNNLNSKFYDLGCSSCNITTDVAIIARYTKTIAGWIRAIDPNAIIIGPELAWHHFDANNPGMFNQLCDINDLPNNIFVSSIANPGKVDIGSFHSYNWPKDDPNTPGWQAQPWTKQDVIDFPRNQGTGSLYNLLGDMLNWLSANGPTYDGQLAITEFNLGFENEVADGKQDESMNSFIAGQYWAECFSIGRYYDWGWWSQVFGIWPWSVKEGSGPGELGMIDNATGEERSTYFHLQMVAKEFSRGRVQLLTSVSTNGAVKAFGVRDCQGGAVMITNQGNTTESYYYSLDGAAPLGYAEIGNINMDWTDKFVTSDNVLLTNSLGDIGPMETHLYRLNPCGEVIYSYEYNDGDYINDLPPVETSFAGSGCVCIDKVGYEWYELDPESNPERIAFSDPTGVREMSQTSLNLFPNPADDQFVLKLRVNVSGQLTIYNNIGMLVHSAELQPGETLHQTDVAELPAGIYNCVVFADGLKLDGRIVIQHK